MHSDACRTIAPLYRQRVHPEPREAPRDRAGPATVGRALYPPAHTPMSHHALCYELTGTCQPSRLRHITTPCPALPANRPES